MKTTAWQTKYGYWMARDFKWFCVGYGDTEEKAIQDVAHKIAEIEAEEK